MKTLQKYLCSIVIWSICIVAARVIYGKVGISEFTLIGIVGVINFIYGIWKGMQYEK